MNIFANQQTPSPKKPEENNTKSIIEHLENITITYGIWERPPKKEKAYKTKNEKSKMWRNLLNQRKIPFFNAIKSEETTKIYQEFMKRDEIFIPRKFKDKITPQDTEGQKIIKANIYLMKLKAQTKILEDKSTHYKTKYQEIDRELITEIRELCPIETQPFLK